MDSHILEVIAGATLAVCLWVLLTVHKLSVDIRGMKTDIKHLPDKEYVDDAILEHVMTCAHQRAANEG